jgi:hypothetical protein
LREAFAPSQPPLPSAALYYSPGNAVHLEEPSRDSANFATPGLGVYGYISNEEGGVVVSGALFLSVTSFSLFLVYANYVEDRYYFYIFVHFFFKSIFVHFNRLYH